MSLLPLLALTFLSFSNAQVSSYYRLVQLSYSWQDAHEYCVTTYGTHLAIILDNLFSSDLLSIISSYPDVWIGANDVDYGIHNFRWVDSSVIHYTNWDGSFPNTNSCKVYTKY